MQSSPPTPPTPPVSGHPKPQRRNAAASLYGIQVRAFLEAADVVDTDPEVIEDMLDGFSVDSPSEEVQTQSASKRLLGQWILADVQVLALKSNWFLMRAGFTLVRGEGGRA